MTSVLIVGPQSSEHVDLWVRAFSKADHQVELLSLREGRGPRIWRALATVVGGSRVRSDLTIIHSMGIHGLLGLLRLGRGRTILVPWGSEVTGAVRGGWRGVIARGLLRRADVVVTTSAEMAQMLGSRWPWVSSRIQVLSWGVAPHFFDSEGTPEIAAAVRGELGLDQDCILVVAPRGQSETYRHQSILGAVYAAHGANSKLRLVAVDGGTPASTDADADVVVRTVSRLSKTNLARLLLAADAVVSIPPRDQRSTTVLEAIASGAHVLLSDIPAYREIATTGATIALLPEPVEVSLTRALVALKVTDGRRDERNRRIMRRHENAEIQMARIVDICTASEG